MADIKKDAERLVNYVSALKQQGATFLISPQETIPPTAGLFSKYFPKWQPDKQYKQNELFIYNEVAGYVKQPFLTSQKIYPPFSVGTEALYGARPKPDSNGIYPYVYNMGIFKDMLVYGTDGNVYKSIIGTYENPSELLYPPEQAVGIMTKYIPDGVDGEYKEWVQPSGAHDAYDEGDKVTHNGKRYISKINGNTTEPGSDPRWWEEVS